MHLRFFTIPLSFQSDARIQLGVEHFPPLVCNKIRIQTIEVIAELMIDLESGLETWFSINTETWTSPQKSIPLRYHVCKEGI
jgi:hypothetical protein